MAPERTAKPLRSGYTTGACAAAAAKAAVITLLTQKALNRVNISLPEKDSVFFKISRCKFDATRSACSVIKDAGDDPDITDGVEVIAEAMRHPCRGITISGGTGVGKVTRPGLEIPVGRPAINPVPRGMILKAAKEGADSLGYTGGLDITISIPDGVRLARKTLNPRLGIEGGISILGTTGIVIPYSVNAYTACISQSLDVALASGCREVVFTTGRRSEKFAQQNINLPEEAFIQSGDFIDYSLKECAAKGISGAVIWGMVGKISKLAAGHLYTNVSDSVVDMKLLLRIAEEINIPSDTLQILEKAATANHFRKLLPAEYQTAFYNSLCKLAALKCREAVNNTVEIKCVVTDPEGVILGKSEN